MEWYDLACNKIHCFYRNYSTTGQLGAEKINLPLNSDFIVCEKSDDQYDIGTWNHEIMWRPSERESLSLQTKKDMPHVRQNQSERNAEKFSEIIAS